MTKNRIIRDFFQKKLDGRGGGEGHRIKPSLGDSDHKKKPARCYRCLDARGGIAVRGLTLWLGEQTLMFRRAEKCVFLLLEDSLEGGYCGSSAADCLCAGSQAVGKEQKCPAAMRHPDAE